MFLGLVHYDSKAFMKGYELEFLSCTPKKVWLNLFNGCYA